MKKKFIYTIIFSLILTSNIFSLQGTNSLEEKTIEKQDIKNFYNAIYSEYPPLIFDNYVHNLTGISALGDYIIIEDGSQWKIDARDYNEAYSWKSTDPILISLNDSFISSYFYGYKYKMTNIKTNTYIVVKLNLGPILTNPYTLFVSSINYYTNQIILSDNSVWKIDPSQSYILEKWITSDCIIIGSNNKSWYNQNYENILINVNMLQEIKANRIK